MVDPLEAELDRLFQLPLAELVEARNALADRLRRAGDKAGAARVKAIKRPVPVAWALNQAHFTQPALLERARERTMELRQLQTQPGVEARRLAGVVEAQRVAAQAVVEAALLAGRSAGLSETALQQRKLFTTVQAWLAGQGDEPPGRMTRELEAGGFDALAGMALPMPSSSPVPLEQDTRRLAEREQLAAAAHDQVHTRAAAHMAAQQARDQIQASIRDAEQKLSELRAVLADRERDLERRAAALEQARAQQQEADTAVEAARAVVTERSKER